MDKVSVVVPIYNCEKYLIQCIKSLINQTYKNLDIILVNDGSTDGSRKICEQYALRDKRISVINKENSGVSEARNFGIKNSKGKYIIFVDADDILDKGVIFDLVNNLNKNGMLGITNCIMNDSKKKINKYQKKEYSRDVFIREILVGNILGVVWGYLFDTSVVKNMKFDKDTCYLEDTLFLIEYLYKNNIKKINFIDNDNYYNYIINENSFTLRKNNILSKCINFNYSLDKINKITYNKFEDLINDKKIILLEKEMRLIEDKNEYIIISQNIDVNNYKGKSFIIKLFVYLYSNKKFLLLFWYYKIRKNIKILLKKKV